MPSALLRAALAAVAAALACVGATSAAAALPLSSGGGAGLSLSPPSLAAGGGADPSAPSSSFCGVVMNDSTRVFSFASVDNATGAVTDLLALPMLDEFGLGVSAGARGGVYYTISANASEQAEVLVADVARGAAGFVAVRLPPEFAFLSLFGVAMLDVDDADGGYALAMVMGYAPDGRRYCFLGLMEGATGAIARPLYNLTEAYRTWVYLYSGISAWDARRGLYYLEAVTGERDTTSLFVFNTSDVSAGAAPLAQLPFPGLGMYMGLAVSPALAALYNAGGPGLVALVDDDSNTAGALWLLTVNGSDWTTAAWLPLFQYEPDTLESAGNNLLELSDDGLTAYSVFYDDHQPIANQVVSAVYLGSQPAREVGRTIVKGSEDGTAAIADIAACPR